MLCRVIEPKVQSRRHSSAEGVRFAGFEEPERDLSDFKTAEQFMQLKAVVIRDLSRSEESRRARPARNAIDDADLILEKILKGPTGAAEAHGAVLSVACKPARSLRP